MSSWSKTRKRRRAPRRKRVEELVSSAWTSTRLGRIVCLRTSTCSFVSSRPRGDEYGSHEIHIFFSSVSQPRLPPQANHIGSIRQKSGPCRHLYPPQFPFYNNHKKNNKTHSRRTMYSRDETVAAVLAFYQQLIKHPYLDDSALITPPTSGWTTINEDSLRAIGKNDTVIDLSRHLPYLHDDRGFPMQVQYETLAWDYTTDPTHWIDELHPIPSHCVYLTPTR